MATTLSTAPPIPVPGSHAKATTHGPAKVAGHVSGPSDHAKVKFQTLLDKLTPHAKPKATHAEHTPAAVPPKAPKAKVAEPVAEKPKEAKKPQAKHPQDKAPDPALTASMVAHHPQGVPHGEVPGQAVKSEVAATAKDKPKAPPADHKAPVLPKVSQGTHPVTQDLKASAGAPATKGDRTEEKPKVFVVDRRSDKEKEKLKGPGAESAALQPVGATPEASGQPKVSDPKGNNDVQITFQTAPGKGPDGFDVKAQNTPVPPRDAASFQQYLVEKGYGQLVDQARIVLKDQNAGEIRMTLYPESLGKVKVALNLTDSSLAGQIFVENQTVKDVFQDNMTGLMQAFRDGGWNDLSLQVSVGNGNGGGAGYQNHQGSAPQARDYDRQVAQITADPRTDRIGSWSDRQVNLTA